MFSKNWRAILVEVEGPEAPHWMNPKINISLEQSYNFRELLPQRGLSYLIGESNCSSPTSNYSLAYQKSFNRTPKGKQPICSCHPSFTGRYKILAYAKPNKQLFILSSVNQPSFTGLQGTLPDSVSVVYFNADLRPFRENRNRAPWFVKHTWQLTLIYFWKQ